MSVIPRGSGGGASKQEKTVTAGTSPIEVTPDKGKLLSKVTVNPTPTEERTVTPKSSAQTILPADGKHLSQVIVEGDLNLSPESIKAGVNIFGVTGVVEDAADAKGLIFKNLDDSGNPIDVVINMDDIPARLFTGGTGHSTSNRFAWTKLQSLEINADEIGTEAFFRLMYNTTSNGKKAKIKASSIGRLAFGELWAGVVNAGSGSIWISAKCTKMSGGFADGSGLSTVGPFKGIYEGINFYCEAESKPTGWCTPWNWNGTSSSTALTTTWGVSEEEFDAL